ncbi:MAG: branched-chain amino acid ABC transporter permease [Fimbriimonadaceae bacterium]|nr:branched-chain amino acid ABC transporter permease [Fimbriimonadaceae bacterium]
MKFWGTRLGSIVLAVAGCYLLQTIFQGNPGMNRLVVLACLWVTLSVSLNLINGITGQFSIGHAGFWMTGAYISGVIMKFQPQLKSMPAMQLLLLMMLIAFIGTGIMGLLVGLPSLRLKGDYLAIVTLGFGEILRIVVNASEPIGGSYGLFVEPKVNSIFIAAMLAVITIAACRNLLQTAHGLEFLSVREDEVASQAMGVNNTTIKVVAFVIGAAFAGAAGAVFAHLEGFISPTSFPMAFSFIVLTMVVLGGTGSITGSVVAAIVLFAIPEYLRGMSVNGEPLRFTLAGFVAFAIAGIGALALAKYTQDRVHDSKGKLIRYIGAVVGAIVVTGVFAAIFRNIPALGGKEIGVDQIRYVIFSLVLIAVMLLRPQGVFGHHEFGWHWFKSKKSQETVA